VAEIRKLQQHHSQSASSMDDLRSRLTSDPTFSQLFAILLQVNAGAVVICEDDTLVLKCGGCSRNPSCAETVIVKSKCNNTGICRKCHDTNMNAVKSDALWEEKGAQRVLPNSK